MRNTKKGFTLVELLTVIAILAVLATVSVVGYISFIDRANNSNAATELEQIQSYIEADLMADNKWEFEAEDGTQVVVKKVNGTLIVETGADNIIDAINKCPDFNDLGSFDVDPENTKNLIYTGSNGKGRAVWENVSSIVFKLVTSVENLKVGSQIIIVASESNYALSTNQKSNNRGQVEVTKEGNTLTSKPDIQILTLEVGTVDGTFALNTGDGYLYAASSSSNYLRTEKVVSDNSSWSITVDEDGVASIVAQGTSTRNTMQYNQASSLFSCYDSASQKGISIYVLSEDNHVCADHAVVIPAVEATCTTEGNTEGSVCSKCSKSIVSVETIDAFGHTVPNGEGKCGTCGTQLVFTIPAVKEQEDGATVVVSGTVSEINTAWSDTFNNISVTISDDAGNKLYLYRLATNVSLGDIITVTGVVGTYEEEKQISAGATAEITGHDTSYDYIEMTISNVLVANDNKNVIVTGTVVSINNSTLYIADDAGTKLLVYNLAGEVTVGQIIKIKGTTATYNGEKEIIDGTFEAVGTHNCSNFTEPTCAENSQCVVCGTEQENTATGNHTYSEATCEVLATCSVCGVTTGELANHNYADGTCTVCGAEEGKIIIDVWTLVTDVTTLQVGQQIVIVATESDVALGTTQNSNNRGQIAITKNEEGTLVINDEVQILTLEAGNVSGSFAFNTGSGYLYAASSSSNHLKTETTLSNNSSWTISIVDSIATVVAQGTNTRNTMQYNKSSSLFSCYSSASQQTLGIYVKSSKTVCVECDMQETARTNATCTTDGSVTKVCSKCGKEETTVLEALNHNYENGACVNVVNGSLCGAIDPDSMPATTATETLDIFASSGTLADDSTKITWTGTDVKFVNVKGSTAIRTSDTDHFRLYATSTSTISVEGGTITKVVITCTSNSYATALQTGVSNAGYSATVDGSVVTITVSATESITFTASAQSRINKVEVTYDK